MMFRYTSESGFNQCLSIDDRDKQNIVDRGNIYEIPDISIIRRFEK
jgi:hypothetical protein